MDFLKKFTDATNISDTKETPAAATTTGTADDQPPSQADLFASAQVFAAAAKSTIDHNPSGVDNYKLAGATADILDAAEHYGKLDTSTGIGSYVDKAEGYLKQYESSNSPPPKTPVETEPKSTTPTPSPAEDSDETERKASHAPPAEASEKTAAPPATEAPEEVTEEKEKAIASPVTEAAPSSEIPGDDAKSEEKEEPAPEAKSEGGDGYGSVLKTAGNFWKKN